MPRLGRITAQQRRRARHRLIGAAALLLLVTPFLAARSAAETQTLAARRVVAEPAVASVSQPLDAFGMAQEGITTELAFVKASAEAAWFDGVAKAQAEAAARQVRSGPVGGTIGSCTGFSIPDYIIQRESGGNPSAANPSGAYGCAQTLLSHYNPGGSCAGIDPYSIQGQRDCVNILSNNGQNLSPWAQTR